MDNGKTDTYVCLSLCLCPIVRCVCQDVHPVGKQSAVIHRNLRGAIKNSWINQ